MTPDGHKLIFVSNRAGGLGMGDLYMAFRRNNLDDFGWDEVQLLPELNSASDEYGPSGFESTETQVLTLFFNSDRPGGAGGHEIYTSTLGADGKFSPPQRVPEFNSSANDVWPVVRLDGLEIFLASNRSGTLGGNDLWTATRGSTTDRWSTPVSLGATVNSASLEGRSWVYAGGARLLFFSNRSGGSGGSDLYETTRTGMSVVPVVGSVTGLAGTTFRTFAQISNPYSFPISGSLLFRRAGQPPAGSDPRISYVLGPFETRTFADLMSGFGTTGLGSLEIAPATGPAPASVVRIEDGGAVIVPQVRTEDVLTPGSHGVLMTPSDLTRFRMNVGVKTFSSGVDMTVALYDGAGTLVRTVSRSFPADHLTQMPASELAGGSIGPNQSIMITINSGTAVVYGSIVSGTGQGSTFQIASRVVQ